VLLDEIGRSARAAPCAFALLSPDHPSRKALDWTLEDAIGLLERETQGRVRGLAGGADAFEAVSRALREDEFDEIIVAPVREERSRWRRRDLVHRIAGLGLPVTVVVDRQKSIVEVLDDSISMR
jgi:hypothetical protein